MTAPTNGLDFDNRLDDVQPDTTKLQAPVPEKVPSAAPRTLEPLLIAIDLIDEDPKQPRSPDNPGFRPKSIQELARSFGPIGPKTPLSLREHPEIEGRYIINHGHRRYRACKVVGLVEVPAYIDSGYDDDQTIKRIQREGQSSREIAECIGRKQASGAKNTEIAACCGKSPSWVTHYAILLDLPEPIAAVFNKGLATEVNLVYELVKAYRAHPEYVSDWLGVPTQKISRDEVKLLRKFLAERIKDGASPRCSNSMNLASGKTDAEPDKGEQGKKARSRGSTTDTDKLKTAIVWVEYGGRLARLMLNKRPLGNGHAWLKYESDGLESEACLSDVKLISVLKG